MITPMLVQASAPRLPLSSESVHCVITSPPYWGLRKYVGINPTPWPPVTYRPMSGAELIRVEEWRGCLGEEPTPSMFIAHLVLIFREVHRVLRKEGTLWLNLGDSYMGSGGDHKAYHKNDASFQTGIMRGCQPRPPRGIGRKNLVGIPWRAALALQADGWTLRSDIIWNKINALPESVRDRPTKSHEHVFLFSKTPRYFYDAEAIREPYAQPLNRWGGNTLKEVKQKGAARIDMLHVGRTSSLREGTQRRPDPRGRNKRDVWSIPTGTYPGAHFAVFPEKLIEPMIKAGTSGRGCCPQCGAPWERVLEKAGSRPAGCWSDRAGEKRLQRHDHESPSSVFATGTIAIRETTEWRPTCSCDAGNPVPCIVLDPFVGSGTTLLVARRLGRHAVGVDLSYSYLHEQARIRLQHQEKRPKQAKAPPPLPAGWIQADMFQDKY